MTPEEWARIVERDRWDPCDATRSPCRDRRALIALVEEMREALAAAISRIEHPCHDACIDDLHADCQCASFVRQEALTALSTFPPKP